MALGACGAAPRAPGPAAAPAIAPADGAPAGRDEHAPTTSARGPGASPRPADAPPWRPYVPVRCRDAAPPPAEGCRPRRVVVTSTDIEILDPIRFVDNTAEIAPGSERMLDSVAHLMLGDPSILVLEVRGHSDSLLHPADRAELARKRAEVVALRLVALGVDPARLTTYGASDTELLYRGDDPRNRRVEFLIVARDE